ncbi:hypothetical protein C1H46_021591 [Malus baccata]|uniref:Glutathione peroxidase n=1 Tax=Malus baccata TaxID=106549 RepID=A0A540M291_MALBA|nr:hypothetical protein C1H46_021591 [Malus baccata]
MGGFQSVSEQSIHEFTVKVHVNGPDTEPVYKFLKASKSGFLGNSIKWNFTKFLVDKDGHVIERYAPTTSPLSIEVLSLSLSLSLSLCVFTEKHYSDHGLKLIFGTGRYQESARGGMMLSGSSSSDNSERA